MFRNLIPSVVFLAGLAVVCWIGVGYVGSNPLGAAIAILVGVCYLAGAMELYRYRQGTTALRSAVGELNAAPESIDGWLTRLPEGLRNAVRLRVAGERVALPAPTLTPYLVGLLVLLGMLGTLLGMMATLRGTGLALESATDLQAMRGSLAAPVKGLGFAFGTSIAGIATSAMLGLLSALVRRDRMLAVQSLDAKLGTTLREHSQTHQREESLRLMRQQAEAMPLLVDRLEAMMASIEKHNVDATERQLASQQAFHATAEAIYTKLAASVEQSLKEGIADSARAASASIQPAVEATMAGLAGETTALRETVTQAVQRQLDGLSAGFDASSKALSSTWGDALSQQCETNAALVRDLQGSLAKFADTFEKRSADLVDGVAARLDAVGAGAVSAWNDALAKQEAANDALGSRNAQALDAVTAAFGERAAALVDTVSRSHAEMQSVLESRDAQRLAQWKDALAEVTTGLNTQWTQASEQAFAGQQAIVDGFERTANEIVAGVQVRSGETITEVARLAQGSVDALGSVATTLQSQWEQAGEKVASQQQAICDTLERTAESITASAKTHAGETIAEISRLVEAAAEAPKVAAEVVGELRQKLSDSMVRDTSMLEERTRLLATLETLLDAVNHASVEQRTAIDALVGTSAELLERVGTRFTDHIEAETGKLEAVAAQVTGSAAEVASLGEAFGAAVQVFGQSNDQLMERLQHIAQALDQTSTRSDEQLAYYVAQAREVVDLSVLSQKQILEDMQRLGASRESEGNDAA